MIDRPFGFSHIRGGEPVNLVMTEQVPVTRAEGQLLASGA